MSYQEAALYGDLVLFLRDRAAELLARDGDIEAQRAKLDTLIMILKGGRRSVRLRRLLGKPLL
ncbi:MAG: hypothetical protein WHX52_05710 [Anaerolineae bacterium]